MREELARFVLFPITQKLCSWKTSTTTAQKTFLNQMQRRSSWSKHTTERMFSVLLPSAQNKAESKWQTIARINNGARWRSKSWEWEKKVICNLSQHDFLESSQEALSRILRVAGGLCFVVGSGLKSVKLAWKTRWVGRNSDARLLPLKETASLDSFFLAFSKAIWWVSCEMC